MQLEMVGMESKWWSTQHVEANTELSHSAFSRAAVIPFEVGEGMVLEHTPEIDITRCHQVLEEGDSFECFALRLARCCFLAFLRVDKHLFRAVWNDLKLPLVGFAFQVKRATCLTATASTQDSVRQR